MKILFLILFLISFLPFTLVNAVGDSIQLYSIVEFRDSNGILFAYFVDDSPFIPNMENLDRFLDTAPEEITTVNNGEKTIVTEGTIKFTENKFSSTTTFGNVENNQYVIYAVSSHDGIPVNVGDTMTTTWIAVIPLN